MRRMRRDEETRRDVVRRGKLIVEELKVCQVKAVRDDGTYYISPDIEGMRNYVDDKYYYKMDDSGEKTPEEKNWILPGGSVVLWTKGIDSLVRVSKNRNDANLEYMVKSCKELVEQ